MAEQPKDYKMTEPEIGEIYSHINDNTGLYLVVDINKFHIKFLTLTTDQKRYQHTMYTTDNFDFGNKGYTKI